MPPKLPVAQASRLWWYRRQPAAAKILANLAETAFLKKLIEMF
jgi:hypothetical protein